MRGGSWDSCDDFSRSAFRHRLEPCGRYNGIGFRCAASK
ncbi:MAG: hypothetical protein AAB019_11305 [Planctomycetota bacterium]